jgi:NAD(P)-dependent dehydrogenase (short-subunit alcohol dehydrogenase family)
VAGGGLDALINNAGRAVTAPVEHLPLDAFRQQLEVNLTGT